MAPPFIHPQRNIPRITGLSSLAILTFMFTAAAAGGAGPPCWEGTLGQPGPGAPVNALAVFDDGTGPALYASSGGAVQRWDGTTWSPLGAGMNGSGIGTVRALAVFDDGSGPALYAGGHFTTADDGVEAHHIAKWDGLSWSSVGTGMAGPGATSVNALEVFDDGAGAALYAGGNFAIAGEADAANIARWDGASWSALDTGTSGTVRALAVFDDGSGGGSALYAAGAFSSAGGVEVNNVARWDGASFAALDAGLAGVAFGPVVSSLVVFDDGRGSALYAGGSFTAAGETEVNRVAKWDGEQWAALGDGMSEAVHALAVFHDGQGERLYAGGAFGIAGSMMADAIAVWDGEEWSVLGSGIGGLVNALATFDDGSGEALYVGGQFIKAGDAPAVHVARWTGPSCPDEAGLTGNCFVAHGGFGCQSFGCTAQVFEIDPSCLFDGWDAKCAALAQTLCHTYQQDRGMAPVVFLWAAMSNFGGTLFWMNQFTVAPGAEVVNQIAIMWPTFTPTGPLDGLPAMLFVWSDPSQDGQPHDAQVIASVPVEFGPPEGEFRTYAIDPVHVGPPGTSFFVGGMAGASETQIPLVAADLGPPGISMPAGKSWVGGVLGPGPLDPDGLAGADALLNIGSSNFVVRAIGGSSPDITGDGSVGVDDLMILLAEWGQCSECEDCPADLNNDCTVNVDDLLTLLVHWG